MLPYPDPPLADGVVVLRAWRHGDVECVREAATDPRIPEGTTVPAKFTPEAGRAFVDRQHARIAAGEGLPLAIADAATDTAVGFIVLLTRPQPGVAGLGYWIVPRARGEALARRAVALLAPWALVVGGLARVEAWVAPGNAASLRTLTGAGFRREGVLRSFLLLGGRRSDAVVFSLVAADLALPARGG